MIDLEENKHKIIHLETKLKNIGDSLWHWKFTSRTKRFRKQNKWT